MSYVLAIMSHVPSEIVDLWPVGGVAMLSGAPGSGKTCQLRDIASLASGLGRVALLGACREKPLDRFGLDAFVQALRDKFEYMGDATLARHIAVLDRIRLDNPETFSRFIAKHVVSALEHVNRHGRPMLLLDDVQMIGDVVPIAEVCRHAGCVLVATYPDRFTYRSPLAELVATADAVITVHPYDEEQLDALVAQEVGATPHHTLWTLLRHWLGDLASNPGTLVDTVRHLVAENKVRQIRGTLLPRAGTEPVTLAKSDRLAVRIAGLGEGDRALLVSVCTAGSITIGQLPVLAASLGVPVHQAGPALDRLWADGLVVADGDRIEPRCLALGASLGGVPATPARSTLKTVSSLLAPALSPRQLEVTGYITAGHSNRWIASRLRISERAVEWHVSRVLAKTGCRSRVELVSAHLRGQLFPSGAT